MKRIITTLGLIWVLVMTLVLTACPKDSKTALEDGFAASVRVSSYGTDLVTGLTQLRANGGISQDKFTQVINLMEKVGTSGRAVHNGLAKFVTLYPDGNVPPAEFTPLALIFNSDIYGPVMQVVTILTGLSSANQALISLAMTGLKTAVLVLKTLMDKHSAYMGHSGGNYATA